MPLVDQIYPTGITPNVGSRNSGALFYRPEGVHYIDDDGTVSQLGTVVTVGAYGASGDGVVDDTNSIQAAIDAVSAVGGGTVFFPKGTYRITRPILLPNGTVDLIGDGNRPAIIQKSTNTLGTSPSRLYRSGTVTDSYAVDSIISIDHVDNDTTRFGRIENLQLNSTAATNVVYAIYAPRVSYRFIRNVTTNNCDFGFWTREAFQMNFEGLVSTTCYSCIAFKDDGSGNVTGTSCHFDRCYANGCTWGFDLFGVRYSTFTSGAVDNAGSDSVPGVAYFLSTCLGITLNSCGAEGVTGEVVRMTAARVVVNGFRASTTIAGVTAGTHAYIWLASASYATFNSCSFPAFQTPRNSFDLIVDAGSHICFIESDQPTGGNAVVTYTTGGTKTVIDGNGVTVTTRIATGANHSGLIVDGKRRLHGTAAPTTGTWAVGDIIFNTVPVASGTIGFVCTTAGTPGTWKTWGTIAA